MLSTALSASHRSLSFLLTLAGAVVLSLGLSGCAGVVAPPAGGTNGTLAVSNVQTSGATDSTVKLSWATNQPATSEVDYGTTAAYGATSPVSSAMVTAHQMTLTGLAKGTTYHFRVRSTNGTDTATCPDQTFSTSGGVNYPPSVQVTSPAAGATVSGKVNVTAVASDNGSVAGVQFRIDGNNVGPDLTAAPYLFVLDSSTLSNGSHSISAIATDNTGKSTTSTIVAIKVDNTTKDTTPPTVSIAAPANGAKVSGIVAVTASASDNVSVASLQFEIDGAKVGAPDAAAPFAYSWDTSKSSNGSHTVRAIAIDGAGNSATSPVVTVTVNNTTTDKTAPTVSITAPAAAATVSGTVNVTATAADNVGVASVQFQVDGVNAGALDGASPYVVAWDTTKIANGVHTLNAIAKDAAGNATTSARVSVTVNNAAAKNFSISGTLNGTGGNSATVTLTGASVAVVTANTSGAYSFTGLAKGTYTVIASHTGFTFSPATQSATITTANVTGLNFTATAVATQTFSISGTISGTGGNGATVALSGASTASTTANASGAFSFTGLAKGNYTVTASHTGFTFSPASRAESITAANITGANFTATATAAQTFSISGTISGAGGSAATVKLTGASAATVTANASGAYSFTGLAKGNYTVTPSHTGFTFSAASLAETITTANITGANFTSTASPAQTFSISGTITGSGASGTTLTLSGPSSATATAGAGGAFTFTGLTKGTYAITPSHSGFTFSPTTQSATINASNVTGVNFATTAAATTFSISGTITPTTGGSGATVILSGAAGATTTTNASGAYTFTGIANGVYTVTPSNSGFAFTPASASVTVGGANKTAVNFTAASNKPHSVALTWSPSTSKVVGYNVYRTTTSGSGYQRLTSSPISATSYDDTTVQSGTTYFYVTTSVDSADMESANSNEVSVTIP